MALDTREDPSEKKRTAWPGAGPIKGAPYYGNGKEFQQKLERFRFDPVEASSLLRVLLITGIAPTMGVENNSN